mgnify:CR=1 FL=1|jgi:hypothetical protein
MAWIESIRNKFTTQLERPVEDNPLDKVIVEKGDHPEVNKVYEARWVWYHTILAVEIFFTNILLVGILITLVIK